MGYRELNISEHEKKSFAGNAGEALLVTRGNGPRCSNQSEVKTENAEIEQVANHKLLGMIIDKHLTYKVHVDELSNEFSKRLGPFLSHISPRE